MAASDFQISSATPRPDDISMQGNKCFQCGTNNPTEATDCGRCGGLVLPTSKGELQGLTWHIFRVEANEPGGTDSFSSDLQNILLAHNVRVALHHQGPGGGTTVWRNFGGNVWTVRTAYGVDTDVAEDHDDVDANVLEDSILQLVVEAAASMTDGLPQN
jgi:ribosomal protein L40E